MHFRVPLCGPLRSTSRDQCHFLRVTGHMHSAGSWFGQASAVRPRPAGCPWHICEQAHLSVWTNTCPMDRQLSYGQTLVLWMDTCCGGLVLTTKPAMTCVRRRLCSEALRARTCCVCVGGGTARPMALTHSAVFVGMPLAKVTCGRDHAFGTAIILTGFPGNQ